VQLLRARFSAYCKAKVDYILETTHADNSQLKAGGSRGSDGTLLSTFAEDVAATAAKLRFSDLVVTKEEDTPSPDIKLVSFEYRVDIVGQKGFGGRPSASESVTETSVFVKHEGKWLFLDSKDVIKNTLRV
jgi:uncharacterized protein YchJ